MKVLLLLLCLALPLQASEPVAVVELFTSEGCSSCPPADDVLAQLVNQKGVLALGFHVDYWNKLGWPDPFSKPEFSRRQYDYSSDGRVYTPQMIVNGQGGFNGSDSGRAAREIKNALQQTMPATVSFSVQGNQVSYNAKAPGKAIVEILQVKPSAAVQVARGENAGRTLVHKNIVVNLVTGALGEHTVTLPSQPGTFVVVLVQDPSTRRILGAAR